MTTNEYYDKASNRLPKWTDDDRQHRRTTTIIQQSMSMRFYLRLLATRICKFHCHSCSTRGDIVTESFACQRYVTNQTDGRMLRLEESCVVFTVSSILACIDSHRAANLSKNKPCHPIELAQSSGQFMRGRVRNKRCCCAESRPSHSIVRVLCSKSPSNE